MNFVKKFGSQSLINNPYLFESKVKGNTAGYKFTKAGAKFFLELMAYNMSIHRLEFPNLMTYLGINLEKFNTIISAISESNIFVIEAASFHLLQGVVVLFPESVHKDLSRAIRENGAGLFVKFSFQGNENFELQRMSDACFTDNPDLRKARHHISNMFMNHDRTFNFEGGFVQIPFQSQIEGLDSPIRRFGRRVFYSVNLPLATFNFNFEKMLFTTDSRAYTQCLTPFDPTEKKFNL